MQVRLAPPTLHMHPMYVTENEVAHHFTSTLIKASGSGHGAGRFVYLYTETEARCSVCLTLRVVSCYISDVTHVRV